MDWNWGKDWFAECFELCETMLDYWYSWSRKRMDWKWQYCYLSMVLSGSHLAWKLTLRLCRKPVKSWIMCSFAWYRNEHLSALVARVLQIITSLDWWFESFSRFSLWFFYWYRKDSLWSENSFWHRLSSVLYLKSLQWECCYFVWLSVCFVSLIVHVLRVGSKGVDFFLPSSYWRSWIFWWLLSCDAVLELVDRWMSWVGFPSVLNPPKKRFSCNMLF